MSDSAFEAYEPTSAYESSLHVRVIRSVGNPVLLHLEGDLDIASMSPFEDAIEEIVAGGPSRVVVDVRECGFVSMQGYQAIAQCSRLMQVEVRSTTDLARTVLALYDYKGSVRVMIRQTPIAVFA